MRRREASIYRTADHRCPAQEVLDSLQSKAAQKVA